MKMPSTTKLQPRGGDPRGQVLVLFALMLVVLLLVSALAVDYGGWLVTKRNYQNATDASALAGAQQLTRAQTPGCTDKNYCARVAAWQSVGATLGFTALPANQADKSAHPSSAPYQENGYKVWVASPPSDAGTAYLGHVSGPGVVYVRIDHAGMDYLSRIANVNRSVTAWSTAGRFPANFAVIAMCSPTSSTASCLAGDSNIKLDGNNTNLIVGTGDLGTNRWVKSNGNNSGVALGPDSNAYMQMFDTCWANSSNQCQLFGYNSPNIDYSTNRAAIPLGAPIPDPAYPAPTINSTTAPNECRGTGSVQLASTQVIERTRPDSQVADLPIKLASAIQPFGPEPVRDAVATNNDLAGIVKANIGGAALGNINVSATNGTTTYNMGATPNNGGNKGKYSQNNLDSGTYTITATDPGGIYAPATATVVIPTPGTNTTYTPNPDILMKKYPTISGVIRSSTGGTISGATVSITGAGGPYNTTSVGGGAYGPVIITGWGSTNSWLVNASATNYTSNSTNTGQLLLDTNYTGASGFDVTLTPAPASLTGTITDAVTALPVPGITVTLGSGGTATTNSAGVYNIASVSPGSTTATLSGTAWTVGTTMDGYMYSTPASGSSVSINAGANTRNYALWPKGCSDSANLGNWSCGYPSGNSCPATSNASAANVSCTFTQANAIRPGTYNNIDISGCAWLDPTGGVTGLAANQSPGIYHIKGTISLSNNSFLFGDGVTLVMDQGSGWDFKNGSGFVLNYGTHKVSGGATCDSTQDFATPYAYLDTGTRCFRSIPTPDSQDRAYAAWTTQGHTPYTSGIHPTYDDSVVNKGQELGMTFYLYGSGLGNSSRFKNAGNGFGFLFNGVLYGPNDDINIGGGSDAQTAAGQIVGWTIEYHGGTRILQNWYGDPVDGQPFLIEPVLGE